MGKENSSDLWDDSALIHAFDQALTKFKIMHTSTTHDDTTKGEKSTTNGNDHSIEESQQNVEPDDKSNDAVEATTETSVPCSNNKTASELSPIQESEPKEGTCFSEANPELAGATSTHDKRNSYEEAEYARLLSQYYEIEEKRQKVLQQLQQVSYCNYSSSTQYQTPQVHQGASTSHLGLLSPCCMCFGDCCARAISSYSCGSFGPWDAYKSLAQTHQISADGQYVIPSASDSMPTSKLEPMGQSLHPSSSAIEQTKSAAERHASSMKFEASATTNVYEEEKHKGREETSGVSGDQMSQAVDLETDLTVVMNAWYSAGFYTGRYLLAESTKKRHQ